MKFRYYIVSLYIILFHALGLAAQEHLSNAQKRQMNVAVLDAIEEYEIASQITDRATRYRFERLFLNEDVKIFCDLYTFREGYLSEVSVKQYSDFMLDQTSDSEVSVKSVRRGNAFYSDGTWHINVNLEKKLTYVDENDILFPSDENNAEIYKLIIGYRFNEDMSSCLIESIQCTNTDEFKPVDNVYIVQKHYDSKDAARDEAVKVGGKLLSFNSFKQAYTPKGQFSYWDDDVRVTAEVLAETSQYQYIQFGYTPKHWRVKARVSYALNSAYDVSSPFSFDTHASSGYEAGLDIGYSWTRGSSLKVGLFAGLALSNTSLQFEANDLSYSYRLTDREGKIYSRDYQLSSVTQGVDFKDLVLPAYASFEFKIFPGFSMVLDAGVKGYFNTAASVLPFHLTGNVTGIDNHGERIPDGKYGLGLIDQDFNEFVSAVSFNRNMVDVSAFANIGFDINLYKGDWFLEAKAGYEMGLMPSYQSDEYDFFQAGSHYPFVYSDYYEKDVVVCPIADCVSFTRRAIWTTVGLVKKF